MIVSVLISLALAQGANRTPPPATGIVVLGKLSSLGSTEEAVSATQRVLNAEFAKLLGDRFRTLDDLRRMDPEISAAVDECAGAPSCVLEVVSAVGWDSLLLGNLAGLGDERVINLRHLSARTGKTLGSQAVQASGDERELIVQIRGAAVQLLAPERYVGTVRFDVPAPGIQVIVDGDLLGSSPLAKPTVELSVGRHAVEASGEGRVPFSEMVEVRYGEVRTITIDLPPNTLFVGGETPYYARWWTWTLAGAGVAGLGLGGYFAYLQRDAVSDIEGRASMGTLTGDDAALFQDADDQRQRSLVFYGIGSALSLTAATLVALDFL
ncbi:MAG: PEGA domain-containing protein [Myxococcota bacterium]